MKYNQSWVDMTLKFYNETLIELREVKDKIKPLALKVKMLKKDIRELKDKLKCDKCGISVAGVYEYRKKEQERIEKKLYFVGDNKYCERCSQEIVELNV